MGGARDDETTPSVWDVVGGRLNRGVRNGECANDAHTAGGWAALWSSERRRGRMPEHDYDAQS